MSLSLRAEARHQAQEAEAVRDRDAAELKVVRQSAAVAQVALEATLTVLSQYILNTALVRLVDARGIEH